MQFVKGPTPKWKSKPKSSPLDSDIEFQKLCLAITSNTLKPLEWAGIYVNQSSDAIRLEAKHPARLVRDHLRRFLRELNLESDYRLIARQTNEPGYGRLVWLWSRERHPIRQL